jgi:hypothetical protein
MKINNPVLFYSVPVIFLVIIGVYNVYKPLPENIRYEGAQHTLPASALTFLHDDTYLDDNGMRTSDQEIFDEIFHRVEIAHSYVLVDLFFFSDFTGIETSAYRELSHELTEVLIAKKQSSPEVTIQVITDPINTMYGGLQVAHLNALKEAGIPVIITELRPLRDSNPMYSAVWRTLFQWWGNTDTSGWLPNPLHAESPHLSTRTYLAMLNYKANHRKVVVTDSLKNGEQLFHTIISSANPHDGSSAHSNSAIAIASNVVARDILKTEAAVASLSGAALVVPDVISTGSATGTVTAQVFTEGAIKDALLTMINSTASGDAIDMAMFYFADRDVIAALLAADARGVTLRLLLDPNKDAFGREKDGSPNRQVANEILHKTIGNTSIRWCNTHGEQCHSKLLIVRQGDTVTILHGSANFTRRNLDDFNLETSIRVSGNQSEQLFLDANEFFTKQWENRDGITYSVPYETYTTTSRYKYWSYRFKEFTGLSRW